MDIVDEVGRTVAANLRAARAHRGWRLDDLAEASGVSRGMIHRIEAARTHPSVATLAKLSAALGVPISELVEIPAQLGAPAPRAGARVSRFGRSTAALLYSDGRQELWTHTLRPGHPIHDTGHPPGTRELLHVTEGTLEVDVGGAVFTVPAGDGLMVRGDRPHSYRNPAGDQGPDAFYTVVMLYAEAPDPRFPVHRRAPSGRPEVPGNAGTS
ncbi:helix-turn-helix domain-containing protein [Actinomadura oligospora]|uniref:helix-turn-helix domain-containing protein n=1 Tax=Actinomadura oligospora TaxID=111804 RepID=UPI0004B0D586|nr:XRE family transcriptional regulator [Actinomadura oligospora]